MESYIVSDVYCWGLIHHNPRMNDLLGVEYGDLWLGEGNLLRSTQRLSIINVIKWIVGGSFEVLKIF